MPLNGAGAGRVDAIGLGESVPIPTAALLREVGQRAGGIHTLPDSVCQATKMLSA